MKRKVDDLLRDEREVLQFLKARFPMYHQCNFFFRDIQYGIAAFAREKGIRLRYDRAERAAREFVGRLEKSRLFLPVDGQTWTVNLPEFKTPLVAPARGAAAPATPAARPAA